MEYVLMHHGIKGQKWGIRRYQNSDGTLTEEGKRRYSKLGLKRRDIWYDKETDKYRLTAKGAHKTFGKKANQTITLEEYKKIQDNVKIRKAATTAALTAVSLILVADYNNSQNKKEDKKITERAIDNYDSYGSSYYDEMNFYADNNPLMDWTDRNGVRHIQ